MHSLAHAEAARKLEDRPISHDTWIHRIARVSIARPLARTAVTPNQVTTARLLTGIAAAVAVGAGVPPWQHIGAAIFVVSVLLDRADGDLARITGQTSPAGHRYDLIADSVSNALILIGLGIGLRESGFGLWAVPMGFVAGTAVAFILWLTMRIEDARGPGQAELPSSAGFDADDAILVVPIVIWSGASELLLQAAAIGAPAFAVLFYWVSRKKLLATEPE